MADIRASEVGMKPSVICHMVANVDGRIRQAGGGPRVSARGCSNACTSCLAERLARRPRDRSGIRQGRAYPDHTDPAYPRGAWFAPRDAAERLRPRHRGYRTAARTPSDGLSLARAARTPELKVRTIRGAHFPEGASTGVGDALGRGISASGGSTQQRASFAGHGASFRHHD